MTTHRHWLKCNCRELTSKCWHLQQV